MLLDGLWFSDKKPVMSTFLKPFRRRTLKQKVPGYMVPLRQLYVHVYVVAN